MDEANLKLRMPLEPTVRLADGPPLLQVLDAQPDILPTKRTVGLIAKLLRNLSEERILYCHWKSNWKIENWLSGDGDLDLLIRRSDVSRFTSVMGRLGFKRAILTPRNEFPGILHFYGYDTSTRRFVHVHAHYQLVLGHDATKNYRIPVEHLLIDSAVRDGEIPLSSPEAELALFAVRMTLKYSVADSSIRGLLRKSSRHAAGIRQEIEHLRRKVDPEKFAKVSTMLFPTVERELIDDCLDAFENGAGMLRHLRLKYRLQRCLDTHSRSSRPAAELSRFYRYIASGLNRLTLKKSTRKQFETGGALIAVVGGDGSGKSTCVNELNKWLGKKFDARMVHLGRPPKSAITWVVGGAIWLRRGILKQITSTRRLHESGQSNWFHPKPNILQQLRWLCTARDRHRLYKKIRRFATNGGIVICDRFPVEKLRLMDGPRIKQSINGSGPSAFRRFLIRREESYYRHIMPPDVLVVLRADPIVAATRKFDEPQTHVIPRVTELWETDWNGTDAHLINANRPLEEVLDDIKAVVWAEL